MAERVSVYIALSPNDSVPAGCAVTEVRKTLTLQRSGRLSESGKETATRCSADHQGGTSVSGLGGQPSFSIASHVPAEQCPTS